MQPNFNDDLNNLHPTEDEEDDLFNDVDEEDISNEENSPSPFNSPIINNNPSENNSNLPFGNSDWKPSFQPQTSPTVFPGSFGSGNSWNPWNNSNNSWGTSNNNQQQQNPAWGTKTELPRNKQIIFCDLLDNIIESFYSQGRQGVPMRGIYDVKIRFDVLDRISAIHPEYLFIISNQDLTPGTVQTEVFQSMITWLVFAVAEYLRMPYENIRCIVKGGFDITNEFVKPNTGLIKQALSYIPNIRQRFTKKDMLVLGSASGLSGQSNRDIMMAKKFGIDYIDIQQMISFYY